MAAIAFRAKQPAQVNVSRGGQPCWLLIHLQQSANSLLAAVRGVMLAVICQNSYLMAVMDLKQAAKVVFDRGSQLYWLLGHLLQAAYLGCIGNVMQIVVCPTAMC